MDEEMKENLCGLLSASNYYEERRHWEQQIQNYVGDDPLSVWFGYILWLETNPPPTPKDASRLEEILYKCLNTFEKATRYYQDRRLIKLYIKYITDYRQNEHECYRILLNAKFGSSVADMYIALAYSCDQASKVREAEQAFRLGITAGAQPLEVLKEAHQNYVFLIGQQNIYQNDENILDDIRRQLQEKRIKLTKLKDLLQDISEHSSHGIATALLDSKNLNASKWANEKPKKSNPEMLKSTNTVSETKKSNQEESKLLREQKNIADTESRHRLPINTEKKMMDCNEKRSEPLEDIGPIKYPVTFVSRNEPQAEWITPITTEVTPDANCITRYNKFKVYPRPNMEFQPEELWAYKWYQRKGIQNEFTQRYDEYWHNGADYGIRLYPHFAKKSEPQTRDKLDVTFIPDVNPNLAFPFKRYYAKNDEGEDEEYQWEEIRAKKFTGIQRTTNETIIECADIDETFCADSNRMPRKSFFPIPRKSCLPLRTTDGNDRDVDFKMPIATKEFISSMGPSRDVGNDLKEIDEGIIPSPTTASEMFGSTVEKPVVLSSVAVSTTATAPYSRTMETPTISKCIRKDPVKSMDKMIDELEMDEASTTHAFNVHLKSLLVSTPRIKSLSSTLAKKDKLNPINNNNNDDNLALGPLAKINALTTNTKQDAVREENTKVAIGTKLDLNPTTPTENQLSTILETSEHASSQATHNTYGSAETVSMKSTVNASDLLLIENHKGGNSIPKVNSNKSNSNLQQQFNQSELTIPDSQKSLLLTPYAIRNHQGEKLATGHRKDGAALKFPIFEDTTIGSMSLHKDAGNFTRLQDSSTDALAFAGGIPIPALPAQTDIDKTTSNMKSLCITPAKSMSLFDSKMETTNNLLRLKPNTTTKHSSIRCGGGEITIPSTQQEEILPPIEEPSLHMMNSSGFSPQQQQPTSKNNNNNNNNPLALSQTPFNKENYVVSPDNTFDFFLKTTPLKMRQQQPFNKQGSVAGFSPEEDLNPFQKKSSGVLAARKSNKNREMVQFEDEIIDNNVNIFNTQKNHATTNSCKKDHDQDQDQSTMAGYFVPETQPDEELEPLNAQKRNVRDDISFMADFSMVANSQPSPPPLKNDSRRIRNNEDAVKMQMIFGGDSSESSRSKLQLLDKENLLPPLATDSFSKKNTTRELLLLGKENTPMDVFTKKNESKELTEKENIPMTICSKNIVSSKDDSLLAAFTEIAESPDIVADHQLDDIQTEEEEVEPPAQIEVKSKSKKETPPTSSSLAQLKVSTTNTNTNTRLEIPSKNLRKMIVNDALVTAASPISADGVTILSETDIFSNDISMIRNSTWLPNHGPMNVRLMAKQHQEQKFKAKECQQRLPPSSSKVLKDFGQKVPTIMGRTISPNHLSVKDVPPRPLPAANKMTPSPSSAIGSVVNRNNSYDNNKLKETKDVMDSVEVVNVVSTPVQQQQQQQKQQLECPKDEMSIYYVRTPTPPRSPKVHIWEDSQKNVETTSLMATTLLTDHQERENFNNTYKCMDIDLNQTQELIKRMKLDPNVNPFNVDLINAFLEQIGFVNYMQILENCMLVGKTTRIMPKTKLQINEITFEISKLVGEGAYGAIYCGRNTSNGQLYALKQERPPNLWEYYICLEVQDRIKVDELLPAFMCVDYALIGNNSSILVSAFSPYGSLIAVCNKIKKITMKNVDEYVVMVMTCELLEIMDHLHSVSVIHADIKADNFLLMRKLQYPTVERSLQLIDFGVAIDMKLFDADQTFNYIHKDKYFKCIEMREERPWTYQVDLYGLASVIHVLLFGKYMDVEKNASGIWMHKTPVPRYFNRPLWENIFRSLLNIIDCKTMPNLQQLRALIKSEIEERSKSVKKMIEEFNRALTA